MVMYYYFGESNTWGRLEEGFDNFEEFEPKFLNEKLISDITNKNNDYIYIPCLNSFSTYIIHTTKEAGFHFKDVTTPLKSLKAWDAKMLISADGKFFNAVYKVSKKVVRIYNLDNILKIDGTKIPETFLDGEYTHENVSKGAIKGIRLLNELCGVKRIWPMTISGYGKRIFQKTFGSRLLKNIKNEEINGYNAEWWFRNAYKGGFCYVNRDTDFIKEEGEGIELDANSIYPAKMKMMPMPIGDINYVEGKPDEFDIEESLAGREYLFYEIKVAFKLKENGIPCIKLCPELDNWFEYDTDYLTDTRKNRYYKGIAEKYGEPQMIHLILTQTDYQLMLDNYDIIDIEYIGYVWQLTTKDYFDEFINLLYPKKQNAKNKGERFLYKLLLNSLSGMMARLPRYSNVVINDDDLTYDIVDVEGSTSFVNVGAAITAYARDEIIRKAMANKDRWLYTDTDSLHLRGKEIPKNIKISNELGDFKVEDEFSNACYFGKKMYAHIVNDELKLTMSGVRINDRETWETVYNHMNKIGRDKENEDIGFDFTTEYIMQELKDKNIDSLYGTTVGLDDYLSEFVEDCYNQEADYVDKKDGIQMWCWAKNTIQESNNKYIEFENEMEKNGGHLLFLNSIDFPQTNMWSDAPYSLRKSYVWIQAGEDGPERTRQKEEWKKILDRKNKKA